MIPRDKYLGKLIQFQDKDVIKVVTGVRRCGKSTLLDLMAEHLVRQGVAPERILFFKMESMEFDDVREDYRALYSLVRKRAEGLTHPYLFFDELQETKGWERAIDGLRVDLDCDIYITGSNAFLLSSELATLLSGRYVEVEMQPLTFSEYLDFRGATIEGLSLSQSDLAVMSDGSVVTLASLFSQYRRYGGFPFLSLEEPDKSSHQAYCKTLFDTVIVRDILEREKRHGRRQITNADLLIRISDFLADNIGNECSVSSIASALRSQNSKTADSTVAAYIEALEQAYLFRHVRRYDIKGKEILKTNGKRYICDVGLRNHRQGYRRSDAGRVLENIVYQQLIYDDCSVWVGHLRAGEVDFVAERNGERVYIQVTEGMTEKATMERELKPLKAVRDAYPKMVVAASGSYPTSIDGIRIVNAVDFLLGR
ncbi:ATP-binding protein [Adlercreutzia sp. ZJ141]|uniref:ATP-binding protein n=1 Tax=Adlercreutzia sp. ZJ141 TaxID=2709406 RepID=UPI0013EDDA55|nr:ATP-binding protein [Adlercreutzia sp. ZJ141]